MTQEEKAKAYDEAINTTRNLVKAGLIYEDAAIQVFPELIKESEDERIMNAIKYGLDHVFTNNTTVFEVTKEQCLAWLEKQGEQKPVQEIEPTPIFKIGDILKRKGKDYTFRVDRIQGGYYHCDRNHGAFFPIEEQNNWELVEQKSADKVEPKFNVGDKIQYSKGCGTIMTIEKIENGEYIFANNMGHTTIEDGNRWYLIEQKPAWSEEDEYILGEVITHLEEYIKLDKENYSGEDVEYYERDINWLKSLRPLNRWKPSDEQIEALDEVYKTHSANNVCRRVLFNLMNDLKKLKG